MSDLAFVTRVGEYSIYYDTETGNKLYIESVAENDDFACVYPVPPNVDKESAEEDLNRLLKKGEGHFDMLNRVRKVRGEVTDDRIPDNGKQVTQRKREGNKPVGNPSGGASPPSWSGPGLGER